MVCRAIEVEKSRRDELWLREGLLKCQVALRRLFALPIVVEMGK